MCYYIMILLVHFRKYHFSSFNIPRRSLMILLLIVNEIYIYF